jgi:hypothetical protein
VSLISAFTVIRAAALPTDFSQVGDFSDHSGFQIIQSGDANTVTMSIHSEWGEGDRLDPFGHLFGPAAEFVFSGNIDARHDPGFLAGFSMRFGLLPQSGDGLTLRGFAGNSLPGESFAIDSAVSGIVDGQEWSAVLTFRGFVAADGSGSGDGSATWSKTAVPDTTSTLVLACLGMASLLGFRRRN